MSQWSDEAQCSTQPNPAPWLCWPLEINVNSSSIWPVPFAEWPRLKKGFCLRTLHVTQLSGGRSCKRHWSLEGPVLGSASSFVESVKAASSTVYWSCCVKRPESPIKVLFGFLKKRSRRSSYLNLFKKFLFKSFLGFFWLYLHPRWMYIVNCESPRSAANLIKCTAIFSSNFLKNIISTFMRESKKITSQF